MISNKPRQQTRLDLIYDVMPNKSFAEPLAGCAIRG